MVPKSGPRIGKLPSKGTRFDDSPDVVFRIAADGSKNRRGYSGTPMDIERITRAEALRLEGKRLYYVHRLTNWPTSPSICPVFLEV